MIAEAVSAAISAMDSPLTAAAAAAPAAAEAASALAPVAFAAAAAAAAASDALEEGDSVPVTAPYAILDDDNKNNRNGDIIDPAMKIVATITSFNVGLMGKE
jgi:hypothetical protein